MSFEKNLLMINLLYDLSGIKEVDVKDLTLTEIENKNIKKSISDKKLMRKMKNNYSKSYQNLGFVKKDKKKSLIFSKNNK